MLLAASCYKNGLRTGFVGSLGPQFDFTLSRFTIHIHV